MATIAHLSDLHLLEDRYSERTFGARARLSYLNLGRPLDPLGRKVRARKALRAARSSGADHLVITGDLTEDGTQEQFELFAELLSDSGLSPERVTLVAGNHDAYGDGDAWLEALDGPLRAFASTSTPGAIVGLDSMNLVPVSTARKQHATISAGAIETSSLAALAALASDPTFRDRPLVFAQHHPPQRFWFPIVQWIDGLREHGALSGLLTQAPHLHVLHGHIHRETSKSLKEGELARIFSASAVVDSDDALRLYRVSSGGVVPIDLGDIAPVVAGTDR